MTTHPPHRAKPLSRFSPGDHVDLLDGEGPTDTDTTLDARLTESFHHYRLMGDSLSGEQKIAAALWLFPRLLEHARRGGNYRSLIRDRLQLEPEALVPLCLGGGLDLSNLLRRTACPPSRALCAS